MPPRLAGSSKKRPTNSKSETSGSISKKKSKTNLVSERIQNGAIGKTSKENGASAENGSFNNEDELIAKLYKEVIDGIMNMDDKRLIVKNLIIEMQELVKKEGSKSEVKEDQKMDLSKACNLCVYLSVHGTCHTGLVKKAVVAYFQLKKPILITNRLRVVSLGGGPGYDLVGFCSALQETYTLMNKIKCKIVDTKGWKPVFKSILRITKESDDYGSLSKLHKNVTISGSFIDADLKADDTFKDKSFSSAIKKADFILMVKLESFLSNYGDKNFVKNVFDAMKDGSTFIFICKTDDDLCDDISNGFKIYKKYHKYKTSFNPAECNQFSTSSDGAHICVCQKIKFHDE